MTAAEHLNNLNNLNSNRNKQPPGEFNHAIQRLNKIKARYADDPNTYKWFLDILQTYRKEQKHSHDVSFSCFSSLYPWDPKNTQVYKQVQMFFEDAPDLLAEFKDFLPEAVPAGIPGSLPGTNCRAHVLATGWESSQLPNEEGAASNKRSRHKPQREKESTPVPPPGSVVFVLSHSLSSFEFYLIPTPLYFIANEEIEAAPKPGR